MERRIYNGIPWYDQNGDPVNAHGACIVPAQGKYYLFGEYKTDDVNKYVGFSCYSTENFMDWTFHGLALPPLKEGLLGPDRIGERVKVLENRSTGKYVMLMHTDDMRYCDPCIGLAVGERIDGEFTFQGPLLFRGEPIRYWDMGTFVDEDGTAYLLTHEGNIYRLDESYTRAVELVAKDIAPGGESPAMFRAREEDGGKLYYLMLSNKTSWERNDNYYFTAKDLHGPWEYKGLFCPAGSLTYNSQCSFVFCYEGEGLRNSAAGREPGKNSGGGQEGEYSPCGGQEAEHNPGSRQEAGRAGILEKGKGGVGLPIYVGDRWSYPRQASAATLVLLPIETGNGQMRIGEYLPVWSPDTLEKAEPEPEHSLAFRSNVPGESIRIAFTGKRLILFGNTDNHGGYGYMEILDEGGACVHRTSIDFYSAVPDSGIRFRSPALPFGSYTVIITVSGENSTCVTKSGTRYGSDDFYIELTGWGTGENTSKPFPGHLYTHGR